MLTKSTLQSVIIKQIESHYSTTNYEEDIILGLTDRVLLLSHLSFYQKNFNYII